MGQKNILIITGEPSGDLHASNLVREIKNINPGMRFSGIAGELSRRAGVDIIFDISELALVGVVEVLKNLFVVKKAYDAVISRLGSEKIDLAILVDYPGFNLKLAKELKRRGIPVVYYISPQVWAWGAGRIKTIKRCVKKVIVFFKFEEELYKAHGIPVEFAGHPLLDTAKPSLSKDEFLKKYSLDPGITTISLLPGSRKNEVRVLLPALVLAASIMEDKLGKAQFLVSKHPGLPEELYETAKKSKANIKIIPDDVYNMLNASAFAIVASGTATLETAIIGTPFLIVYKASYLTYILYKLVAKTPFIGLANIIAGRKIVPELLQSEAVPRRIASEAIGIITNSAKMAEISKGLASVKFSLGECGASRRAAQAVLSAIR